MDKRNVKKLNKAAIATVLAASGVAAVAPQPTNAKTFKDVNPLSDAYKPIMELSDRGIINGYKDGTFRPNEVVTRGQAAKMIALALRLDVKNVKNPNFKDVPSNHQFYPYIAALVQRGFINGYSDRTFQPNEPITRGQIAKLLTLGYEFQVASKLTHDFRDVTGKNSDAYFIQTLVNLNITKGVTPTKFGTFNPVTRGQLATFIVRAENADGSHVPVNTVGKIEGNKVYINSVAYTIDSSLKSIFNESNAAVLQGAHIEGNISGTSVKSITKLTINASGTNKRNLVFNGNNATFSGELVVKGSYIQFKNWTLTGTVTLAENPIRKLSDKRMQNFKIASVSGFGFIDWTKPTEPEKSDILNPSENENLIDKPSSNSTTKVVPKMSSIQKFVDFSNCWVNRLIIEQNRTHVVAKNKITTVTVKGYTQAFELYADVQTMYFEQETAVAMYGSTDIKTVYNNSYYDVFYNSDSYVDVLVVDNSFGWIDLGEHFYIGKVVLPKGKSPSDIFDDFKNDSDRIKDIEDEDGKPVDRDPIENEIIPDRTSPVVTIDSITVDSKTATVTIRSNENGTYYYIVREADEPRPSIREVLTGYSGPPGVTLKDRPTPIHITGLTEETEYKVYVVVVDNSDNVSALKESLPFTTTDGTPPQVNNLRGEALRGGQRIQFNFKASEPGTYYYYIRKENGDVDPLTDHIINNSWGQGIVSYEGEEISRTIPNLLPNTNYEIYVVMKDRGGNASLDPAQKITILTGDLDNTPPYLVDENLHLLNEQKNEFYIEVSEELDKATSENIQNYVLSGTGIINLGTQKKINPEKAVYDKANNRVILTIPSLTGFVHGDNLIVEVLPGVKDMADNNFENTTNVNSNNIPRNKAEYIHSDDLLPTLNIVGKPEISPDRTSALITYDANKAGTYHYVIMESGITASEIDGRELIKAVKGNSATLKVGTEDVAIVGSGGNNPAQIGKQKIKIPFPPENRLSPFKSYDVYIVLRDRSGNVSLVRSASIISDRTAPTITGVNIAINNGDTTGNLRFNSNEMGAIYYIVQKKSDPALPSNAIELKQYLMDNGTRREMKQNLNLVSLTGLDRHEDYVLYLAVEDVFGNVTVYENETMDVNGNVIHNNKKMQYEFYTDGTKPKIDGIIKKLSKGQFEHLNKPKDVNKAANFDLITYDEDQTFLVTFSESIILDDVTTPFFVIKDSNNQPISPSAFKYEFEPMYDENKDNTANSPKNTWSSRRMIIKFNDKMVKSFSVTIDADAVDVKKPNGVFGGNNKFGENSIGYYYSPADNIENTLLEAVLTGSVTGTEYKYSNTLDLLVQINTNLNWKQTYYYAVTNNNAPVLTAEDIIKSVDTGIVVEGITQLGKHDLDISSISEANFRLPLTATVGYSVFTQGQRIYLLTVDQYGNIVMAQKGTDKFIKITAP